MPGLALRWIESNGGPLLLLPRTLLKHWSGIDVPSPPREVQARSRWNPDGPATDYDRACDLTEYVAPISVGPDYGLVLGDEPLPAAVWRIPDSRQVLIVRWAFAESDSEVERWLTEIPGDLEWQLGPAIQFRTGALVLFDSAEPGAEIMGEHLEFAVPAGMFDVVTAWWQPDSTTRLLLHRLVLREPAT